MKPPKPVTDFASNSNENIAHAAKVLGRSFIRRKVFEAIYHGKQKIKTVGEIAEKTNLDRKQVLIEGKKLVNNNIVEQTKHNGDTAYAKRDDYHYHKAKILSLAADPASLHTFPTKRNMSSTHTTIRTGSISREASMKFITLDDIETFKFAHSIPPCGNLPKSVSETQFKELIQSIINEPGEFKDWGGEINDLFTTRLQISGKRRRAAFAFKGPGTTGKLTPGKMGKNGDQIQRLFESDAELFIVQYWREIDQSVVRQMTALATRISFENGGKKILYGIIDGADSNRIYKAYGNGA